MSDAPGLLLTLWARTVFETFAELGVKHVVISPGSRSTPFVAAALETPMITSHVIIDERSASFFALGIARVSEAPVVLLCTSGSAGAHYLPAVIEADASRLGLVLLTADRPEELQACAAAQTSNHRAFFREFTQEELDLGSPVASELAFRNLRRKVAQAVAAASGPSRGPAHLNAPARMPLDPVVASTDADRTFERTVRSWISAPPPRRIGAAPAFDDRDLERVVALLRASRRGVVIAGPNSEPGAREALEELSRRLGYPLLAETTSQARYGAPSGDLVRAPHFELVWSCAAGKQALLPEIAVVVGQPPTSNAWERLAQAQSVRQVVLSSTAWADPQARAEWLSSGPVVPGMRAIASAFAASPVDADAGWLRTWEAAERECVAVLDHQNEASPLGSEGRLFRSLAARVPAEATLFVGNSLAIRELDILGVPRETGPGVLSQRGVNGIDGAISGAAGTASAIGAPVIAVIGDVTFLHDVGGLIAASRVRTPLVFVVINNGGGRIFEMLPLAKTRKDLDAWTTPHDVSFADLARAYHIEHVLLPNEQGFAAALDAAVASPGATIIEIVVRPHSAAEERIEANAALEARLSAVLGG